MEENLSIVDRAWIEDLSRRNQDHFVGLHADDVVMHDPTLGELRGREALGRWFQGLFEMFPDYKGGEGADLW